MHNSILSKSVQNLAPSANLETNKLLANLKSQGINIISLTIGDPSALVPSYIKQAGIDAILQDKSKYSSSNGLIELRIEIAKSHNKNGLQIYTESEVVVTSGCKQAIFNLFMTTINPGDEVIIPDPFWSSYIAIVKLFGGIPVILKTGKDFLFSIQELNDLITSKTKFIILNSPNNPTGVIYPKKLIKDILQLILVNPKIHILSDEIYSKLIYSENVEEERYLPLYEIEPKILSQLFIINGLSKAYSMTGWRLGWICSKNLEVIKAIGIINSQSITNVCNISQYAAICALREENANGDLYQRHINNLRNDYKVKINTAFHILNQIKDIDIYKPKAAFYFFIDIGRILSRNGKTLENIVEGLIYQKHVAVLSGKFFGRETCIRISVATELSLIIDGCNRIVDYLSSI